MADNLPLIPNKRGGCAGDVQPVLRAVFREHVALLPPLPPRAPPAPPAPPTRAHCCPPPCMCDDVAGLPTHEAELRLQRVQRLARHPPPHPFTMGKLQPPPQLFSCIQRAVLHRSDLMPRIDQKDARNTLWIKNILNGSSGDASTFKVSGRGLQPPLVAPSSVSECLSAQSMSLGEVVVREPLPPRPQTPPTPLPEYIVCVPTSVCFVNFTPGKLYTCGVRLVNMSAREVCVSVRGPARRELAVQLRGRLRVTAGARARLLVLFTPRNVCALHDELLVRVEGGRSLTIPISCYIQPPILEVLMPNVNKPSAICGPEEEVEGLDEAEPSRGVGAGAAAGAGTGEVLELGARLLGEEHCFELVFSCEMDHVSFFIVTEEAWLSHDLSEVCETGAMVCGEFAVTPSWWRGGGEVRGAAWCRATRAGLHTAALRILATNAISRPLHLLADALLYCPKHIVLKAQDKTYDICSDDEQECEYYVNLGTTFPHRSLAASIQIINLSPLTYTYYWTVRPWGKCTCWQEELAAGTWLGAEDDPERLCAGADEARAHGRASEESGESGEWAARAVRVEPAGGAVPPRSAAPLSVLVPDAGDRYGHQRAVLILVLKNIPQKSFPPGFYPMIVSTSSIVTAHIPGFKREERVVCDVVCCQLEVWWRVVPLWFALDPPLLHLPYSRRVSEMKVSVRVTQLWGAGPVRGVWRAGCGAALPPPVTLRDAQPQVLSVTLPLSSLPNHFPVTESITLEEERNEWSSRAVVRRWCATRHPALRAPSTWLGIVPPHTHMHTNLHVTNDTYQKIYWWCDVTRWLHENQPQEVCGERPEPCPACSGRGCSCRLLSPARGALQHGETGELQYDVNAPGEDGCVATLVRVRRTEAGVARLPPTPPACARAALVAYRVLAPRLRLLFQPCDGDEYCSLRCGLDPGGRGAVLRPARALVAGRRACCRLRVSNLTPLRTTVKWDKPPDGEQQLRIIFIPEEFDVDGYEDVEIRVVLEPRVVCARRVWARRALVRHASDPLYVLVDALISGVEVDFWLPLDDYSFCIRLKQREMFPWSKPLPNTAEEAFIWEDAKRAVNSENVCHCRVKMRWMPPPPAAPLPPGRVASPTIEFVSSPPVSRTCDCFRSARPHAPAPPRRIALEARQVPINSVHTLRVRMRSACELPARWSARARLGVRDPPPPRHQLIVGGGVGGAGGGGEAGRWAALVRACGSCCRVSPARGVLRARTAQDLELRLYADTWGIYREQILILVEGLEPLVVNLWLEAVGSPLQFALRPAAPAAHIQYNDTPPALWVTESDPVHVVRARNTSRAALRLHAYLLRGHEHVQDGYPFRLCIRLFDVLPVVCPCLYAYDQCAGEAAGKGVCECGGAGEEVPLDQRSVSAESMDTGVELYLAPDVGVQDTSFYKVEPLEQEVRAGGVAQWTVTALQPALPEHTLLLRTLPLEPHGVWWHRCEPAAARVRLRGAARTGRLQVSHDAVLVHISALQLPLNDALRVRKRICVQNVGDGRLVVDARIPRMPQVVQPPDAVIAPTPAPAPEGGSRVALSEQSELDRTSLTPQVSESTVTSAARHGAGPVWSLVRGALHACSYAPTRASNGAPTRGPRSPRRVSEASEPAQRSDEFELTLPAHSASELCVEVCVRSAEVCPAGWGGACVGGEQDESPPAEYNERRVFTSQLHFHDQHSLLKNVELVVKLEVPRLVARPALLEFGYVCEKDTRKTYFTLSHTSRTDSISVFVKWCGDAQFRLHPSCLLLPPDSKQNVYIIYTGQYTGAVSGGWAVARAAGAGGAWCCAAVRVRARCSRDYKCHLPVHDHTDDTTLLPETELFTLT